MPPPGVRDSALWARAVKDAKSKFKRWPSALASYEISRRYKELGGTYRSPRAASRGTARWQREEWVEVEPMVARGRRVKCGSSTRSGKACRPRVRVSPRTPPTIDEVVRRHGKQKVVSLARAKARDMDGRLNWKAGPFRASRSRSPRAKPRGRAPSKRSHRR